MFTICSHQRCVFPFPSETWIQKLLNSLVEQQWSVVHYQSGHTRQHSHCGCGWNVQFLLAFHEILTWLKKMFSVKKSQARYILLILKYREQLKTQTNFLKWSQTRLVNRSFMLQLRESTILLKWQQLRPQTAQWIAINTTATQLDKKESGLSWKMTPLC